MINTRIVTAASGLVAATGIVIGAAALSNASTPSTTTTAYSAAGSESSAPPGGRGGNHTPVTGAALTKVTAAVKAKDSAVTVTSAQMDEDGSYDVFGTKAGAPVRLEVSKDLNTITVETGRGGHGGPGGAGSQDTPVTGAALTKVTAAVKAKDSAVTVTSVRMDPDGSYDVFGTKAGATVMLEVSKDLTTITTHTGAGPGGGEGRPA
jgi:hypothetical protein